VGDELFEGWCGLEESVLMCNRLWGGRKRREMGSFFYMVGWEGWFSVFERVRS
jgi:hypothetical protein